VIPLRNAHSSTTSFVDRTSLPSPPPLNKNYEMSAHHHSELCYCESCVISNIKNSLDANGEIEERQIEGETTANLDTGKSPPSQIAPGEPLPNRTVFWAGAGEVRENNLPYEMSLIEYGELQCASGGGVAWNTNLRHLPHWVDANNKQVTSNTTGNSMSWLAELPFSIPNDVPAWQLHYWFRAAASQGHKLRQQDIFDRMANPMSHSSLSSRMQTWQDIIGLLPPQHPTASEWPSKQRMEAVSRLSYAQLKFNTWWDVCVIPDPAGSGKDIHIARQPRDHPGYRDTSSLRLAGTPYSAAHYIIENPEHRQMSERVKLLDDAMLFLTIKAEECGILHGFDGIMAWISKPAEDKYTEDLDIDLVCEFERWREGCPDTLSVVALRSALEQAGLGTESDAIEDGDYSLVPHLQGLVNDLASAREKRKARDAQTKTRMLSKSQKKRKTAPGDDKAAREHKRRR